jgi:hypothetical protein
MTSCKQKNFLNHHHHEHLILSVLFLEPDDHGGDGQEGFLLIEGMHQYSLMQIYLLYVVMYWSNIFHFCLGVCVWHWIYRGLEERRIVYDMIMWLVKLE